MSTVFLCYKEKELLGFVEMDIPWQLCQTIGPLTLHSQGIGFADIRTIDQYLNVSW